ncbi:MAG: MFS transporter [Pirellulales bacterium]|nr:MFS transporter [Pirellulales bacterium]
MAGARWSLCLLLAINLFNYIDRQVLAAVVPVVQTEFKASDREMGLLATAFLLSYMGFAPLFGWLADRFGRWMLVGIGVILWSLASGASGLATELGVMLLTRTFVGIGEAAYGPIAPTIISDLFPIERRGRVLAWFYTAIPVGSALGYLLGGQVVGCGWSWHWAFFLVVPPGILLGILALLMCDPPREDVQVGGNAALRKTATLRDYKQLLRIPSYLLNTAGMTAMTFALGGLAFWVPKYIVWRMVRAGEVNLTIETEVQQATADANFWFGVIVVVSGLVGTLAGGWLGDKLRSRFSGSYFLVSGAAMLLGFPLVATLIVTPFPAAWLLIFAACLCVFFNTGPTNTVLANVTHPSIRAAGYAVNIFVIHALGDAISPLMIGWVNDLFAGMVDPRILAAGDVGKVYQGNMNAGFLAVSFAILISGLFWLWGARHLERDTQRATTSV